MPGSAGYRVRFAAGQGKTVMASFWSVCTCSALSMLEPVACFLFFDRASVEARRHFMVYTKLVVIALLLRKIFTTLHGSSRSKVVHNMNTESQTISILSC